MTVHVEQHMMMMLRSRGYIDFLAKIFLPVRCAGIIIHVLLYDRA